MLYTYERFYVAHLALMFLTFIPSAIIFLCSLCMARRRGDSARRAFTYLKAAFGVFTLFIFLDFCNYGLSLASTRLANTASYYSDYESVLLKLQHASAQTYACARFVHALSDVFVLLMLVSLGSGILFAQSGNPSNYAKFFKFGALGLAAIIVILDIAFFGLRTDLYTKMYKYIYSGLYGNMRDQFLTSRQIDFAIRVLLFVAALAVLAQSVMVKLQTKGEARVSSASHIFISCALLWLLRNTYEMASIPATTSLSNISDDPVYHNYFIILDVVLSTWPQLILLGLVYGLGRKKVNGLWSTEQPFMTQGGSAVSPWGFSYDPNQVAPPAAVHQSQAPPVMQQTWAQNQPPQPYYPQPGQNGVPYQQPQYAPAQQVPVQQSPIQQAPAQQPYYVPPGAEMKSPPPMEDTMGFNHQANGATPQTAPQPYYEKA